MNNNTSLFETLHPHPLAVNNSNSLSEEEKMEKIEFHFAEIMKVLGLDLLDPSLKETPKRIAKMYVQEIFKGLSPENFPEINTFPFQSEFPQSNTVLVKDIVVHSFCEHHFVPMFGKAHIAYIPKKRLIGLSKINRITQFFCQRPQLQERLTEQIADSLSLALDIKDVAVYIEAKHFCVAARGAQDEQSFTITHSLRGEFECHMMRRQEFFQMIK